MRKLHKDLLHRKPFSSSNEPTKFIRSIDPKNEYIESKMNANDFSMLIGYYIQQPQIFLTERPQIYLSFRKVLKMYDLRCETRTRG